MVSSKDIEVKEFAKRFRGFSRELLEHLCTEAYEEKDGIFLSLDKVMKQFWPLVRAVMEGQETPPQVRDRDFTDLEGRLGSKLFQQLYHDALDVAFDVKFGHISELKRQLGAPRKDLLASEAASLKREGMSYAQIAVRLNQKLGKDTTTQENVRGLLKSRRLKPQKAATPPDKTRN
jgi:hypothetical protein